MTVFKLLIVFTLLTSSYSLAGEYSRRAKSIWQNIWERSGNINSVRVVSPDRLKSVTAHLKSRGTGDKEEENVLLVVNVGKQTFQADIGPGVGSEILWSDDSKAFVVTTSDAGLNGMYRTIVYFIDDMALRKIDVTGVVVRAFGHPVQCGWPELPNVAGIKWLEGSRRLLVAAEIVHHSVCDSFGTFRIYELGIPDKKIVRSYSQLEAKRLFGTDLGGELKQADDNCIRRPRSCWVAFNHRSKKQ